MSFLPSPQLDELVSFAAIADKEARSDLVMRFIKDENDYTSNFTGALRRIINSNSLTGLTATSFVLEHRKEREIGADAAIILSRGRESKVAVYEAKWPRFSIPGYEWDYDQTATGLSHFSDQLERQKPWSKLFAVFEMFYTEHPFGSQPGYLDDNGSSCVWQDQAELFRTKRTQPDGVWSKRELETLLRSSRTNISTVMTEFGLCKRGEPILMTDAVAIGQEFQLPQEVLAIDASIDRLRKRG